MPSGDRPTLFDRAVRALLTPAHAVSKMVSLGRRKRSFGAHALALTPDRRMILVKLRYAPGWRLPGGGRREDENPAHAVVRELREEIGMVAHGRIRRACELEDVAGNGRDLESLLIVEDVHYSPRRWSWEVEAICEAPLDDPPSDLSQRAEQWIAAVRGAV